MKPSAFEYHAPKTVEEAVATLSEVAPKDGRVLAGGQSLVPIMAFRLARPAHLVDINGVEALARLATGNDTLCIGAGIRHAAFYEPVTSGPLGRLLATVVQHIGHHPIRTRGTFCGSLAHADPSSEWCLTAATLDAEIIATSNRGARTIAAKDFFAGIMTTTLEEDELLTEVRLPVLPADTRFGFCEFSRRAGDFALGAALVTYRLKDGAIVEPHVGIGATEPLPRRIEEAEGVLAGQQPSDKVFRAAADAAAAAVDPLEDFNTSADYRRDLIRALTRRALERAAGDGGKG